MNKIITLGLVMLSISCISQDTLTALAFAPSGYPIPLREGPDVESRQVASLECGDSVLLLSYFGGNYYYVAPKKTPKEPAYLHIDFLVYDKHAVETINKYSRDSGGSDKVEFIKLPKDYMSRTTKSYPKNKPSYSSGSSGRTIHTGPRGGKYYINKNGKKTYVKH